MLVTSTIVLKVSSSYKAKPQRHETFCYSQCRLIFLSVNLSAIHHTVLLSEQDLSSLFSYLLHIILHNVDLHMTVFREGACPSAVNNKISKKEQKRKWWKGRKRRWGNMLSKWCIPLVPLRKWNVVFWSFTLRKTWEQTQAWSWYSCLYSVCH